MSRRSDKRPLPTTQPPLQVDSQPVKRQQTQSHYEQSNAEDEVRQIISRVLRTLPVGSLEDAVLSLATTFPSVLKELRWLLRDDEGSGALEAGHLEELARAIEIQRRFTKGSVVFVRDDGMQMEKTMEMSERVDVEPIISAGRKNGGRQRKSGISKEPRRPYEPEEFDNEPTFAFKRSGNSNKFKPVEISSSKSNNEVIVSVQQKKGGRQLKHGSDVSEVLLRSYEPVDFDNESVVTVNDDERRYESSASEQLSRYEHEESKVEYDSDALIPGESIQHEYNPSPPPRKVKKASARRGSSGKSSQKRSESPTITIISTIETVHQLIHGIPEDKSLFRRRWGVRYSKGTCVVDVMKAGLVKNKASLSSDFEHKLSCLSVLSRFGLEMQENIHKFTEEMAIIIISAMDDIITSMTRKEKDKLYSIKKWVERMELLHKGDSYGYYERTDETCNWVSGSLVELLLEKCLPTHLPPRQRMGPSKSSHDPYNHRIDDLLDDSDWENGTAQTELDEWFEAGKKTILNGEQSGCRCYICKPPNCKCRLCEWEREQ